MELNEQQLKVQLLETQLAFFRQTIELAVMKIEKLDELLRQEKIILMALERSSHEGA